MPSVTWPLNTPKMGSDGWSLWSLIFLHVQRKVQWFWYVFLCIIGPVIRSEFLMPISRKFVLREACSVFLPLWVICKGMNLLTSVAQNTAVIYLSSLIPAISSSFLTFTSIVPDGPCTMLIAVCSQWNMSSAGICSIQQPCLGHVEIVPSAPKFSTVTFFTKVLLLFTNFILYRSDMTQSVVVLKLPRLSTRRVVSCVYPWV